jgi:hypothetical protein
MKKKMRNAEIVHPNRRTMDRNVLLTLTIAWYLLGLIVSYLLTGTDHPLWERYYFVWDKGKDLLLVWTLSRFVYGTWRSILQALLVFLVIRLLWEAIAIPNYKLASRYEIIDVLFLIDLLVIIYIMAKTIKWPNSK